VSKLSYASGWGDDESSASGVSGAADESMGLLKCSISHFIQVSSKCVW
jgi:hypothetical protein